MLSKPQILLVTPVWNDSLRLSHFGPQLARALVKSELSVRWVIADDGSSAEEVRRLKQLVREFAKIFEPVELFQCAQRYRKGGAIYEVWNQDQQSDLLAFVDADGAIDSATVIKLLEEATSHDLGYGVIGVRKDTPQTPVSRPVGRSLSFSLFSTMVRVLLGVPFLDTQCGVKVVPAIAYRAVADQLKERGFVFDVELLVALSRAGVPFKEVPVAWSEMPGGKVHPLRDAWAMVAGLLRIRQHFRYSSSA